MMVSGRSFAMHPALVFGIMVLAASSKASTLNESVTIDREPEMETTAKNEYVETTTTKTERTWKVNILKSVDYDVQQEAIDSGNVFKATTGRSHNSTIKEIVESTLAEKVLLSANGRHYTPEPDQDSIANINEENISNRSTEKRLTIEEQQSEGIGQQPTSRELFLENLKWWITDETKVDNKDIQMDRVAVEHDSINDESHSEASSTRTLDIHKEYPTPLTASADVQQSPHQQGSEWYVDVSCPPENECQNEDLLHVVVSSSEGLTIPTGINLTIRCTVTMPINHTSVRVDWHSPQPQTRFHIDDRNVNVNGKDVPQSSLEEEESVKFQRIHVSNEMFEQSTKSTLTIISTLRVINVTAEKDSGNYVCSAGSHSTCCRRKAKVNVTIYTPPSHATDIAIICVICFLEFVIILYCKTKNTSTRSAEYNLGSGGGGGGDGGNRPSRCSSSGDYEPLPRTTKEAEFQTVQQHHVKT